MFGCQAETTHNDTKTFIKLESSTPLRNPPCWIILLDGCPGFVVAPRSSLFRLLYYLYFSTYFIRKSMTCDYTFTVALNDTEKWGKRLMWCTEIQQPLKQWESNESMWSYRTVLWHIKPILLCVLLQSKHSEDAAVIGSEMWVLLWRQLFCIWLSVSADLLKWFVYTSETDKCVSYNVVHKFYSTWQTNPNLWTQYTVTDLCGSL